MVKIFYGTETTGTKPNKHSIHQLSGIVEVDGVIAEEFNFKVRPHPKAEITKEAMVICGKTEKEILAYPKIIMSIGKRKDSRGLNIKKNNKKK